MVIEIINFILGPTCTSIQNQQHNENVRSLQNYHLPSINYSQIPLAVSFHGKKENFFFSCCSQICEEIGIWLTKSEKRFQSFVT